MVNGFKNSGIIPIYEMGIPFPFITKSLEKYSNKRKTYFSNFLQYKSSMA